MTRLDGPRLAVREVFELQKFVKKKDWIDERIKFVAGLPLVDAFAPLPPAASTVTPDQLREWSEEHARIEQQVEDYDFGDLDRLRNFARTASKQELSATDADLIDITLGTLLSVDKLLHLLDRRRRALLTLAYRLDWEKQVRSAFDTISKLDSEIDLLKSSIASAPTASIDELTTNFHALNTRVTSDLVATTNETSGLLDDIISAAGQSVPDAFLDHQDSLEGELPSLCAKLQSASRALQTRREEIAAESWRTSLEALIAQASSAQSMSLEDWPSTESRLVANLNKLRQECATSEPKIDQKKLLNEAESVIETSRQRIGLRLQAQEHRASIENAIRRVEHILENLQTVRLSDIATIEELGSFDRAASRRADLNEPLSALTSAASSAATTMSRLAREGIDADTLRQLKDSFLTSTEITRRAETISHTLSLDQDFVRSLQQAFTTHAELSLKLFEERQRVPVQLREHAWVPNMAALPPYEPATSDEFSPLEAYTQDQRLSAALLTVLTAEVKNLDNMRDAFAKERRLTAAVRAQTQAVIAAFERLDHLDNRLNADPDQPDVLTSVRHDLANLNEKLWEQIPMLGDDLVCADLDFNAQEQNELVRNEVNDRVARLRAKADANIPSLASSIIEHKPIQYNIGVESEDAIRSSDVDVTAIRQLIEALPSFDALAGLDAKHSLSLAFPTREDVQAAQRAIGECRTVVTDLSLDGTNPSQLQLEQILASKTYAVDRLARLCETKANIDAADDALSNLINSLDAVTDAKSLTDYRQASATVPLAPSDALLLATQAVTHVRKAAVDLIDDYRVKHAVVRIESTFAELQAMLDELERRPPSATSSHSSTSSRTKASLLPIRAHESRTVSTPLVPSTPVSGKHGRTTMATLRSVSAEGGIPRSVRRNAPTQTPSRSVSATTTPKPGPRLKYRPDTSRRVDVEVAKIVNDMPMTVPIKRAAEESYSDENGLYWIGDRLYFCRILRSKTTMVRIGGGWSELSAFLYAHFGTTKNVFGVDLSPASEAKLSLSRMRSDDGASKRPGQKGALTRTQNDVPALSLPAVTATPTMRRTTSDSSRHSRRTASHGPSLVQPKTPAMRKSSAPDLLATPSGKPRTASSGRRTPLAPRAVSQSSSRSK